LELRGPGLRGSLTSVASVGREQIEAVRGRIRPLGGFTFPGFRERVPRWTVTYVSRAADAEYATAIDVGGSALEARPVKLSPKLWRLELREPGARPLALLEVARDGERLKVRTLGT
jgi:hypothetical protein